MRRGAGVAAAGLLAGCVALPPPLPPPPDEAPLMMSPLDPALVQAVPVAPAEPFLSVVGLAIRRPAPPVLPQRLVHPASVAPAQLGPPISY